VNPSRPRIDGQLEFAKDHVGEPWIAELVLNERCELLEENQVQALNAGAEGVR